MGREFKLHQPFPLTGDQPRAVKELVEAYRAGQGEQVLLGVTGSGKTYTIANVVQELQIPTLVLSHNKTLAAQLYGELRGFFPENAVEFFISYYDYYQPEAFIPSSNTYIEKDASINDEIDRLRLRATSSLLARKDVIVVASVSCIFGLGNPENFRRKVIALEVGAEFEREKLLAELVSIQYTRNDVAFTRGTFRVRGDVVEIKPAYEEEIVRVELFGDEIDRIAIVDPITGEVRSRVKSYTIYPASLFVTDREQLEGIVDGIGKELEERLAEFDSMGRVLEAQRLASRTRYDMEMLLEMGYCSGVENYSRYFDGRRPGQRPACLLDYFPKEWLLIMDESHVSVSQVGAMYNGDRSRKETLVEHGFRLPSALDNRPLTFEEFNQMKPATIYVSATPGDYELERCGGVVVEQIIRPTGLMDPKVELRPVQGQVDDLMKEIQDTVSKSYRVLVTTLTKRMAEDLTDYLSTHGARVQYLHSDIAALDRVEILRGLRLGEFDVLVGINLLREGLDLPEVGLVAVLDADKEGFLRSERSLIQTAGRAARNVDGRVILYADSMTGSMRRAIEETNRRRAIQRAYNEKHGITPRSIQKSTDDIMLSTSAADGVREGHERERSSGQSGILDHLQDLSPSELLEQLTTEMYKAAKELDFETAAVLRDRIDELRLEEELGGPKSVQKERHRSSRFKKKARPPRRSK
ncbi:MAG TPA: excinuclease ABC subunit UvrB [Candidatus Krumholzibacteria bacterium]|nr:excinuclease ABC subunit UvrB [Candidatus Krumholzibacteria bacterium]